MDNVIQPTDSITASVTSQGETASIQFDLIDSPKMHNGCNNNNNNTSNQLNVYKNNSYWGEQYTVTPAGNDFTDAHRGQPIGTISVTEIDPCKQIGILVRSQLTGHGTREIYIKSNADVSALKKKIQEVFDVVPSQQQLVFNGRTLTNGTLESYGLTNGSLVELTGRLRGGLRNGQYPIQDLSAGTALLIGTLRGEDDPLLDESDGPFLVQIITRDVFPFIFIREALIRMNHSRG